MDSAVTKRYSSRKQSSAKKRAHPQNGDLSFHLHGSKRVKKVWAEMSL